MLIKLPPDEGMNILLSLPVELYSESISLPALLGRIISEDISAVMHIPPFAHSLFDGYAFRGEDTLDASFEKPAILTITDVIPAGSMSDKRIESGMAAKILTGAPIPSGANAVTKYENTEFTDTTVKVFTPIKPGTDIMHAGQEVSLGERIAYKGTIITASLLGLLAEQGIDALNVFKRPAITVINTGSELVEVGSPLAGAQIYNSNFYIISSYLDKIGATPLNGGIVKDDPDAIANCIRKALDTSDMVITTGGASGSDYDWAVKASQLLGADILFWKIDMKPGGAMTAAILEGKLILGLSGSPGAALTGLLRVAMPYIRKLCGKSDIYTPSIETVLREPIKKSSNIVRILRGKLEIDGGVAYFVQKRSKNIGTVSSREDFDLLGEVPADSPPLRAGTKIKSYLV